MTSVAGLSVLSCSGKTDIADPGLPPITDGGIDGDADASPPEDARPDQDASSCSYQVRFEAPTDGAQLTEADDIDGDQCTNGFQYNVRVASDAPDGTRAELFGNTGKLGETTVDDGVARFDGVQLDSQGQTNLRAVVAGECSEEISIGVACAGLPSCQLAKPVLSDGHPKLNNVPVSQGGDRVSADGSAYQVAFEVTTNVADGQPVTLTVDGSSSGLAATAVGGLAKFPGVTLVPDGDHKVQARCVGQGGKQGTSALQTYPVDTLAPPLVAQKVDKNGTSGLDDGAHWGPDDDAEPSVPGMQIRVCGATDKATAPDALDLPASLGAGQQNFCLAVGSNSPTCMAATTGGAEAAGDGACVSIDCPGGGPFDLSLTLRDDAGNPTSKKIQAVTCASELPQVQIVEPAGDAPPWTDVTKHILAASMAGGGQRVDKNAGVNGAQYDVIACTSATGGTARLLGGVGTQNEIATGTVVAASGTECGALTHVVRFLDVTLPESHVDASLNLEGATRLTVEVTSESTAAGSGSAEVWVDSRPPTLSILSPTGLCGKIYPGNNPVTASVRFTSTIAPVYLTVNGTQYVGDTVSLGLVTIPNVVFSPGDNELLAWTTEPSGNVGRVASPCTVIVGNVPTVTWVTPLASSRLAASATTAPPAIPDADPAAPAWQGSLRVCTNINMTANPGATIQFSNSVAGNMGSPVLLDSEGCADAQNVTVPEGNAVTLTATTSEVEGYSGKRSISVPVDVIVPSAPTSLTAAVLDRRQTSFQLKWTAPADGAKNAAGYDVRVSRTPIATEADFATASSVIYGGTPAATGMADGVAVGDRIIETDYYFAVAARDIAGNRSSFVSTPIASRANFNATHIQSAINNERRGYWLDGSSDINNDGLSDLLVGSLTGLNAYIHLGSTVGYGESPSVIIQGSATRFSQSIAAIGDVNHDGLQDIAIGSVFDQEGAVFVFYGRASWPSNLDETEADVIIRANAAADPRFGSSFLGFASARLGDFNGDGVDDFAISAPYYNGFQGYVAIVLGAAGGLPTSISLPEDIGTRAIGIAGDPVGPHTLGYMLLGLGRYYPGASGQTSLVATSPLTNSNRGKAYAFSGATIPLASLDIAAAANVYEGPTGGRLGLYGLTLLRDPSGSARPVVVLPSPYAGTTGTTRLLTGAPSTGPFSQPVATFNDTTAVGARSFGKLAAGSAIPGSGVNASWIGNSAPDLVLASSGSSAGPRLYIVSAETLNTLDPALTIDASGVADVTYPMPAGWIDFASFTTPVRDLNGDGYGDIAVGEFEYTYAVPFNGRVLVLW